MAAEFETLLGKHGRLFAPQTLQELDEVAALMRASPPEVIAVHGGDGTLHRVITALARTFGAAPLPPFAILGGGTMNVVSASLGIRQEPKLFLISLLAALRAGRPLETIRRRALHIGDMFGFIFGNGLMANFLTEYYGTGSYGPARAAWLLTRAAGSAVVSGPFMQRLFKRFEGTVEVDGQPLDRTSFVGIGAATVREVGMGFKLNHRADDDPERFGVLAIHARPVALIPDFWSVHVGRGIAPGRAFSAVASTLTITPKEESMAYTVDGDLYKAEGAISIGLGPHVSFVKPDDALIGAAAEDTMVTTR